MRSRQGLSDMIRALRRCYFGKQVVLAVSVRVGTPTISRWESGARAPRGRSIDLLLLALYQAGATHQEVARLSRMARAEEARGLARGRSRKEASCVAR